MGRVHICGSPSGSDNNLVLVPMLNGSASPLVTNIHWICLIWSIDLGLRMTDQTITLRHWRTLVENLIWSDTWWHAFIINWMRTKTSILKLVFAAEQDDIQQPQYYFDYPKQYWSLIAKQLYAHSMPLVGDVVSMLKDAATLLCGCNSLKASCL